MKPDMARLTLARKIAAYVDTLEKGGSFDAEHLKWRAAYFGRLQTEPGNGPGCHTRWLANRYLRRSGSRESINR